MRDTLEGYRIAPGLAYKNSGIFGNVEAFSHFFLNEAAKFIVAVGNVLILVAMAG